MESTLLYKYQAIKLFKEQGQNAIPNNYLYFNDVCNFNDPFEGIRCYDLSENIDDWNSKLKTAYQSIKSPVSSCRNSSCENKEFNPKEKNGAHCKQCGEDLFDLKNAAHAIVSQDLFKNACSKKVLGLLI